ncbi:MAG: hypothetical protein ABL958_19400 [Bdellovibrionia bacterium]
MKHKKLIQLFLLMLLPVLTLAFTRIFYNFSDKKGNANSEVEETREPKTVVEFKARIKERKAQTEVIDENIEDLQLEIRNLKDEKQIARKTLKREQFIYNAITTGHLRINGDSMLESLYPTIEIVAQINTEARDDFADIVILGNTVLVQLYVAKLFGTHQKDQILESRVSRLDKLIKTLSNEHDLKKLVMFFPANVPRAPAADDDEDEDDEPTEPKIGKFEKLESLVYDRYQNLFEKVDVKTQKSGEPKIVFEVVAQAPDEN